MLMINTIIFLFKKIDSVFKLIINTFKFLINKLKNFNNNYRSVVKQGLVALVICAIGDLIAGIILGNMNYFIESFPGLLIIIPGAIAMRGNIFGSLASRLNTNLHIGTLSPEFKKSDILNNNILSSIILTLVISLILSIIAKIICLAFNFESMAFVNFALINIFAGIISCIIMLPITMFISLKSYEYGWDPDNITTPLITAAGDLFTLPSLIISILLLFFINNELIETIILIILIIIIIALFIYGLLLNNEIKKILSQSTPVLLISSCLGIFAGGFLHTSSKTLLNNQTLLTLVPLFSGVNGSLLSILSARLSSGFHAGFIEPMMHPDRNTLHNFAILFVFGIFIFPFIALIVEFSLNLIGSDTLGILTTLPIIIISGFIVITIMMTIIFYLSVLSVREGLDPDNIVLPISTSLTDLISIIVLTSFAVFILNHFMF
jgi:mgtE-like transporter